MKPGVVLASMHGNLSALKAMVELGADLEVPASNVISTEMKIKLRDNLCSLSLDG